MDGQVVSPLDLSQTLPAGGGLLVQYSLSGYPAIKQLMQMVTLVPGQGGRFQSVCFPLHLDCIETLFLSQRPQIAEWLKGGERKREKRRDTDYYVFCECSLLVFINIYIFSLLCCRICSVLL